MAMLPARGLPDDHDRRSTPRFPRGAAQALPPRPILITFDDGRLDSYRGADPVLEQYGFRATMFVITEPVERGNPFYLRWNELPKMRDSGRWDLQEHAGARHKIVRIDAAGTHGAFFANRMCADGNLETFAAYERRVRATRPRQRRLPRSSGRSTPTCSP